MGLTVDSSQLTFLPSSKSRDTKTKPNIRYPARPNLDIVPYSLGISGKLPAPIVNGGGAVENCRISKFEGLVTLTLTLDRVILHTIVMQHSSTST